ncbi:hypothetical protein [Paractinoplanes toevensis]|uniref:Right handed beta helix domain-containing protein n=1 Tax=Paractinoplanes toevensis TaxID=571911 RepID=A0A919W6S5_9ACTN|nr:hypothetical protein [Actinoplanes toevensis]GIM93513.1 hypothetical protein Ato02nite_053060 [Actinoplanes toevensis]
MKLFVSMAGLVVAGTLVVAGPAQAGPAPGGAANPVLGTNPSIAVASSGAWRIAFQANDGKLWTRSSTGAAGQAGTGHLVAPHTSPSIVALPNGAFQVAYQTADAVLGLVAADGTVSGLGLGMAAGTSPSMAANAAGDWTIAFVANDGKLWTRTSAGTAGPVGAGHPVAAGTSPSAVALPDGGFEIAYQTADGLLGTVAPSGAVTGLGLGMAAGTSPSIAARAGGWQIGFQANDGTLWTRTSAGAASRATGAARTMMPGSAPSVIADPAGGYRILYQTSDGLLGQVTPDGTATGLGLGVLGGTSPSAAAGAGGWQVAFQANNGKLWFRSAEGTATDLGLGMTTFFGITSGAQLEQFLQGIATPRAVVLVAGGVELDLSGLESLPIAAGVLLAGDRSVNPRGPRLRTTTFPRRLFEIGTESGATADDVRISGLRFDGGASSDPYASVGTTDADGVTVWSSTGVEIDHSEFSRWRGSAINVHDGLGRINRGNAGTVHVHDNYLHDNQHPTVDSWDPTASGHGAGYGVTLADGAYALIERNVFSDNRHSITGDGKVGTGYLAYRNLLLHAGIDSRKLGYVHYNHLIDMHGRNDCGAAHYNCGPAGEYADIQYNAVADTDGTSIMLRGTPTDQMNVEHNVFRHTIEFATAVTDGALDQTETGLHAGLGNTFGTSAFDERKSCDFDADGTADPFMATGVTWWYASSAQGGRWVYLDQSAARVAAVQLGDVNGDGRCDVVAGGSVFVNQR